jgi:hypothetical protein
LIHVSHSDLYLLLSWSSSATTVILHHTFFFGLCPSQTNSFGRVPRRLLRIVLIFRQSDLTILILHLR